MVTRKCDGDQFLIRPTPLVNQILLYLLILKSQEHGILIHGFCFLSNHFHIVFTDVRGTMPEFMREFLTESSKAVQIAIHRDGGIWSKRRYDEVALLDIDAAERKLVYTTLNPTRDGLTRPGDWPGVTSANLQFGDSLRAERPDVYFSPKRPQAVEMELVPLTTAFGGCEEESWQRIQDLRSDEEAELSQRRKRPLAGPAAVLQASIERRGNRHFKKLNPRFATRNPTLMQWAKESARQFEIDHDRALNEFLSGNLDVLFPEGTYGYRVLLGVRVAGREAAA